MQILRAPSRHEDSPDLLADCRMMLRFAREMGADLSPELRRDIAELDAMLKQLGLSSVSELPPTLLGDIDALKGREAVAASAAVQPVSTVPSPAAGAAPGAGPDTAAPKVSGTELALKIHGALSKVIAPATALTLRATEPSPGNHGVVARMPKIVKWAAVAALVSAIGFVASAGVIGRKAAEAQKKPEPAAAAPVSAAPAPVGKDGGSKP